jgi:REP-associated tyrosine transposase
MANTYTQIYIQAVFSPKYRARLISPKWEDELYKYMTGILQNHGHKMLAINGMPDHIHLFFGMKPHEALSDLIGAVKKSSTDWINDNNLVKGKFQWQLGFGGFSYADSQIDRVAKYVMNQKNHHKIWTFKEEYLLFLEKFKIEYKDEYIFEFF